MKKLNLILCFLILTRSCFAQETITITKDSANFHTAYQVLKDKPEIKQGSYQVTRFFDYQPVTSGFYKNNLKDSLWQEFDSKANIIAEGRYKDGKKYGEWAYYDNIKTLINTYNYTTNQLNYHRARQQDTAFRYRAIRQKDTIITKLDRAPIYLDGDAVMQRYFAYHVKWPVEAVKKELVGTVVIGFIVDSDGRTHNYGVLQSIGYGCDEEAMRLIKQLPDTWLPGKLNGQNVTVMMRLPMWFNFKTKTITYPTRIIYLN